MSRSKSLKRGPKLYQRDEPRFEAKTFLIVTEGKKTEPNYLKSLRNRLQLKSVTVEIVHPEGTDPKTLVNEAIKLRDARSRKAKTSLTVPYDEVWVVFDLEGIHDERRKLAAAAIERGTAIGIKFAQSDPCFEFWLLLHEKDTHRPFHDCAEVIKSLKRHIPGYAKGDTPSSELLEKLPTAVINSERCRKHHETCDGDGNPSTEMDILARCLNAATRPHFQFKLD